MMRGEGSKQKKAGITTENENPTKETWLSLCVGVRTDSFGLMTLYMHNTCVNYTVKQGNLVKQEAGGGNKRNKKS